MLDDIVLSYYAQQQGWRVDARSECHGLVDFMAAMDYDAESAVGYLTVGWFQTDGWQLVVWPGPMRDVWIGFPPDFPIVQWTINRDDRNYDLGVYCSQTGYISVVNGEIASMDLPVWEDHQDDTGQSSEPPVVWRLNVPERFSRKLNPLLRIYPNVLDVLRDIGVPEGLLSFSEESTYFVATFAE